MRWSGLVNRRRDREGSGAGRDRYSTEGTIEFVPPATPSRFYPRGLSLPPKNARRSRHKYERQGDTSVSKSFTCRCSLRTRSTTLPAQPAILEAMSTERCRAASLVTLAPGPCTRSTAHDVRRRSQGLTEKRNRSTRKDYQAGNTMPLHAWEYKNCLCIHVNNQTVHAFLGRRNM